MMIRFKCILLLTRKCNNQSQHAIEDRSL